MSGIPGETARSENLIHERKKRPWPVSAAGILLIFQAAFLSFLFPILVGGEILKLPDAQLGWLFTPEGRLAPLRVEVVDLSQLHINLIYDSMAVQVPGRVTTSFAFFVLSIPVFLNAFTLFRLWKHAWTMAIFWEGTILAAALVIYFNFTHPYIYLVMASAIFLVFYLNTYEVQRAFPNNIKPVDKK